MNDEFNWWLLIVGLVVGAGLVWLVVADSRRREVDVEELEREGEARWISDAMRDAGRPVAEPDILDVLRLHAAYLGASPPDEIELDDIVDDDRWVAVPPGAGARRTENPAHAREEADRRSMAHPVGAPDQRDREGGQA